MVYVVPGTLSITPADPYNTDILAATVWITNDLVNFTCDALIGYTKTFIHLIRRRVGEPWSSATEVANIDCYSHCCLDITTRAWVPNVSGVAGWHIQFRQTAAPSPGSYEYMAIDDEDFKKLTSNPDLTRVATQEITVTVDPDMCTINHCSIGCPDYGTSACQSTECDESDYVCQILKSEYLPYMLIGGVLVIYLMSSRNR